MRWRRVREPGWLDWAAALLVPAAALAALVAFLHRRDWVLPAEGAGPHRTHADTRSFVIALFVLAVAAIALAARARYVEPAAPLVALGGVIVGAVLLTLGYFAPYHEVRIAAGGFGADRFEAEAGQRITFYNTTDHPVTICLGLSGDCDAAAAGPNRLRSPGLTVEADHRAAVPMPDQGGDLRITIVQAGFVRRDAVLHAEVPPSTS